VPKPEQITDTDPMRREVNRGLMIRWMNADLLVRYVHDLEFSIILYDDLKVFELALPGTVPMTDAILEGLYAAGIRYWSKGIV
jgi:hypothetical protein